MRKIKKLRLIITKITRILLGEFEEFYRKHIDTVIQPTDFDENIIPYCQSFESQMKNFYTKRKSFSN